MFPSPHACPTLSQCRGQTRQSIDADALEVMTGECGEGQGGHCHCENRAEEMSGAKDDIYVTEETGLLRDPGKEPAAPGGPEASSIRHWDREGTLGGRELE